MVCLDIQVARLSRDLAGIRGALCRLQDVRFPQENLDALIEESRKVIDLTGYFVLKPEVDHTRSFNLVLSAERYLPSSAQNRGTIVFHFSPVVSFEPAVGSWFYASYDRGFLWGAGFLCRFSSENEVLETWCVVQS